MNEPDAKEVEQRLAAVLKKERREAIVYTILTVLCTPAFVVLVSLVAVMVLGFVLGHADHDINAKGLYTGVNVFLAYMLMFVLIRSNPPEEPHAFDKMWLTGVCVFLLLLALTYVTPLRERSPLLFGIVYVILGFLVLGLIGHVQLCQTVTDETDHENIFFSLILAVSGFIAMAYGEITSRSWLWVPPKLDEVHIGAWLLCKLAMERTTLLESQSVPKRVVNMLSRLKLVKVTEHKLRLTLKGQDLVMADSGIEYVVKE